MEYNFREIEKKWQEYWEKNKTFHVQENSSMPKYYVLDMFPYPSGAGLHVGHPLGYIASDIFSRYKRHCGFNVLHPMGYDAFGLPAEQYAIQTGQHPATTTENNIRRYREQMDKIGFSYDWSREVRTCDPEYYKWTQWVFLKMFGHWYNNKSQKAEPVEDLIKVFSASGNALIDAACSDVQHFSAGEWNTMTEKKQQEILLNYRIAYLADTMVNWCPALGTVLANDEVKDGLSVRGGHPVSQKIMKQWCLRISAYAERLLDGLNKIDWTESLKEMQRNWVGKSEGANIWFNIKDSEHKILIFTTRPDTIYGSTFMVLAPEHELTEQLTTPEYHDAVKNYILETKKRTERERMADVKKMTGQFTGSYAVNPYTNEPMPVWISDYVLAGYGTGAIMAVPAHDSRDFIFARQFGLPVVQVIMDKNGKPSDTSTWTESFDSKEGVCINSSLINGLEVMKAIHIIIDDIEKRKLGNRQINFRLRDAIFSRQRYWGEPFPIYYKEGVPYAMNEKDLPLELPQIDKFLPTEDGQPPLGRAVNWKTKDGFALELSTMPGFAGSSAYYLRYMDPQNKNALVSKEANAYWQDVDLYIGGTEHATGHLMYARFWNKFLFDLGLVVKEEPFKKLINQGMIQGRSNFVYRAGGKNEFVSFDLISDKDMNAHTAIPVDVSLVSNDILNVGEFKKWRPEFKDAEFILGKDGKYHCGWAVEKMSKSRFNVVNPDSVIDRYGADTLRMYEMFLGPLEQSKPWDTNGIEGAHRFFKKLWRLFYDDKGMLCVTEEAPLPEELKVLHKTIKKIREDIGNFSFNTSVSAFMICINELGDLKCHKRAVLHDLAIILSPFAPHAAEELWAVLGNPPSISSVPFPEFNQDFLVENDFEYPVSVNGKLRFKLNLSLSFGPKEIEEAVLKDPQAQKWLEGKPPKKVIVVPGKIVNVVV